MVIINKSTGQLTIKGDSFSPTVQINKEIISHKNPIRESYTKLGFCKKNIPCKFQSFYKNGKLKSINIYVDQNYINSTYSAPINIDFGDYLTPYIEYCKKIMNDLLETLIGTTKRTFSWGKVSVITDLRDYTTFIELKYR